MPVRSLIVAVAALASIAWAPVASAMTLEGVTTQNELMHLTTGAKGKVEDVVVNWSTRCFGREFEWYSVGFERFRSGRRSFSGVGFYNMGDQQAATRIVERVEGHRRRGTRFGWVGTYRATIVARRNGRVVERCALPTQRWKAGRHRGSFSFTSEEGNWVGGGGKRSYRTATAAITAFTGRDYIEVRFDGDDGEVWFIRLRGKRLRAGRFGDDHAEISGDGRGCGTSIDGDLRIRRLKRDGRGWIRQVDATFTQRCSYDQGVLRARFSFRRGF